MKRRGTDISSIISHHAEESLELLDSGGGFCGSDGFDFIWKWDDALLVYVETEEVEFGDAEYAFCAIDNQSVFGEEFEYLFEVLHMFLW